MATWDVTTPAGSDARGNGFQVIKDMKSALQTALQNEGIFPGATPAAPVFLRKFGYGTTGARPAASIAGRWYYNTTTQTIQRDTGTTWENIAFNNIIPTGKKTVFYNASAPTGWTQDVTNNDCFLRIVSGAGGGSGGSDSISTPPTHNHSGNTTNNNENITHVHATAVSLTRHVPGAVNVVLGSSQVATTTGYSGDVLHTHPITSEVEFTPKYANVIICYR